MMGLIGFIVTLSILVLIHEFGHYAVARWCGVKVLSFSLGFGPVVARWTDKHGCEWRLSALPFGGYVSMLEEGTREKFPDMTDEEFRRGAFEEKSVWQRLAVVVAGPAMNIVLAVMIYAAVAMVGTYEPSSKVSAPVAQTQSAQAGVERGWTVKRIGDDTIESFNDIQLTLVKYMGEERVPMEFMDEGERRHTVTFSLKDLSVADQQNMAKYLGLAPYMDAVVIASLEKDGAAQKAGVKAGQRIVTMNGRGVTDVYDFIHSVKAAGESPLTLLLENLENKEKSEVVVTPEMVTDESGQKVARIGVRLGGLPDLVYTREGFFGGIGAGFVKTWDVLVLTGVSIGKMITGTTSAELISGPLMIGSMAGQSMQYGILSYVLFLALISVNLGFLNLLPIPMLDGGHILYYVYEIFTGSKPNATVMAWGQKIGILFVMFLLALGLTNDLTRIFG